MYIIACRAHFCHLLGLGTPTGSPGGVPPGEPVGVLGPWTGAQCGWAPSPCAMPIHPWHPYHPKMAPWHPLGFPNAPTPLVAPEYLESLPAPNTPLTPPDAPDTPKWPPTTPRSPQCPLYPFWPLSTLSPCQPPIHPWHPLHPWCPDTPKWFPTPLGAPSAPWCPLYPFWFSIVVTLQMTIFMQLKCSFSIVIISNSHHFATDQLYAVKMLIFYHCHFQLSSLCNWPSSGVCPVYNIPSVGVKGTSSVLWSSANFSSSSQNIHYKAPVASQHWKTNKVVCTWKDDWPPRELLLTKDLLPKRVTI